jgi:hypothetical protein
VEWSFAVSVPNDERFVVCLGHWRLVLYQPGLADRRTGAVLVMFIHDVLRKRLLERAGIPTNPFVGTLSLEEIYRTQWSERFETLMRNRVAMGYFRYGSNRSRERRLLLPYDNVGAAKKKLQAYLETGNQEHLVDAANLCMVEFMSPTCHPAPHFASIDDGDHTRTR